MTDANRQFIATCAAGFEQIVANELQSLGAVSIQEVTGAVTFSGSLETAYRACLWSGCASRIIMPIAQCPAPDPDALYHGALKVDWDVHIAVDATFAVSCTTVDSPLHTRYAALRVKDAIADQFMNRFAKRPSVSVTRPDVHIMIYVKNDIATLGLDLSGESLHRRGYRVSGGEAPLKESLAAAIVRMAGWSQDFSAEGILLDPLCGSATLLIEAALLYSDSAPGLGRNYFGFLKWRGHDKKLWDLLVTEAVEREQQGLKRSWPRIIGFDADSSAVGDALKNVEKAGLVGRVHVERRELANMGEYFRTATDHDAQSGMMITNPPYGQRLSEVNEVKYLYRCMGRTLQQWCPGWRAAILIAHTDLTDFFDLESNGQHRLYNGPLQCQLRLYQVPGDTPKPKIRKPPCLAATSDHEAVDFTNRLRKNIKSLEKWARREGVTCYRIYDADIPEYNVAIDLYEQWVHVQEYAPPKTVDPEKAELRRKQVRSCLPDLLGINRNRIFFKLRTRQKGRSQYQKRGSQGRLYEVGEGACRLLVNFSDYIDTGLFLDHRIIRSRLAALARGRRFLNLFGYTGSATVHAARGGASTTTTVDLSPVYLGWARSNMALNGFATASHQTVRSDCMAWLAKSQQQFDLILVDPPTFSNSKSTNRIFDVQRDHAELLRLAMRRLEPGGLLVFSTNFRRFCFATELMDKFQVRDVSSQTIPPDFTRNSKIHRCWEIKR